MTKQTADTVLMIRPAFFGYNAETAASNAFQGNVLLPEPEVQQKAVQEFDAFVKQLRAHHIHVLVIEDTPVPPKPDAIFPNNWFCTLPDGTVATFPMFAANRRMEVRSDLVQKLKDDFIVSNIEDWTVYDAGKTYLEGTGSMIIDHHNKIIYACLSPRTDKALLEQFCNTHGYKAISFFSKDENGTNVYHTNVIMHVGEGYAVICLSSIQDKNERNEVIQSLQQTGHHIIDITMPQVHKYAGNMLQVADEEGRLYTILSQSAFDSLCDNQKQQLEQHTHLLPIRIPTIETVGGGSVRCMMAEIFLKKSESR